MVLDEVRDGEIAAGDEEGMGLAEGPAVVTFGLIGLNLAIFLVMVLRGVSPLDPSVQEVIPWGANFGPLTESGQWWRLFTACFLHFGVIHVGMNMFILYQAGPLTEALFGRVRYLLLYVLAGVFGNIAGLYVHPLVVGAGASGAVFGVYGALLGFLLVERGVVPAKDALALAKSAGIFLVYNLVYGLVSTKTDLTAHLGGLVVGFLAGCILARPVFPRHRLHGARTLGVLVGGGVLAVGAVQALPRLTGAQETWYKQTTLGPSVSAGRGDKVFYSGEATRGDAENAAKGLNQAGYFRTSGIVVLLTKGADGMTLSLPVGLGPGKAPWEDAAFVASVERTGAVVVPFLGEGPLRVRLVGTRGELRKEIGIDRRFVRVGQRDGIFYSRSVTEQEVVALGKGLLENGFFQDKGSTVLISREIGRTELSFVVGDGMGDDARLAGALEGLTRRVAGTVGGLPVVVHLVDRDFAVKRDLVVR